MNEVFTHSDHGRVEVIRQVLEEAGIQCGIRDEEEVNLIPGVTISARDSVLCVADEADVERAEKVIADFLAADKAHESASDWVCEACGESVPGNFDSCWKCDALKPSVAS